VCARPIQTAASSATSQPARMTNGLAGGGGDFRRPAGRDLPPYRDLLPYRD
jgi:hypothetical protein